MIERARLNFTDDKVEIPGIDQPTATLHHGSQTSRRVVLKVPGHSYWSGIGQQAYAPAEFQVYERNEEDGWHYHLISFPVRKS